jgi:HrpA-like RNA helicase
MGVQDKRRDMVAKLSKKAQTPPAAAAPVRSGGSPGPLRLVVMSATLEASSFSDFFNGAPVVYSQGRKYPVDMFYTEEPEDDYLDAALCAVCQINEDEPEAGASIHTLLSLNSSILSLTTTVKITVLPQLSLKSSE